MILHINDQMAFPVKHFMDNIFHHDNDNKVNRMVTASIDAQDMISLDSLMELVDKKEYNLVLTNDDRTVWSSNVFNHLEYHFEARDNDNGIFEEKYNLAFSIRKDDPEDED